MDSFSNKSSQICINRSGAIRRGFFKPKNNFMGASGINKQEREAREKREEVIAKTLKNLQSHPNFKMPNANLFSNPIAYTCYCVSQLVSPLQHEGESNDIECVDLAAAIQLFQHEITQNWLNRGIGKES